MVKGVADEVGLLGNLRSILTAARAASIKVFFVPHRRWEPGDYEDWDHPNPSQRWVEERQTFAKGSWGANGIQISEHWAQSGFANTDLDFQLKQHGVTHVVTVGLLANTCIESTSRFAMELGYHVTLVRDATAAFSHEFMHAAHDLNGPTFAHAILTTPELLAALPPAAG
jgi:nicotinamidase-related amidase